MALIWSFSAGIALFLILGFDRDAARLAAISGAVLGTAVFLLLAVQAVMASRLASQPTRFTDHRGRMAIIALAVIGVILAILVPLIAG